MPKPITIRDIQTIVTQPTGSRWVLVKVITSEPGLYGLGCATFTQRAMAVVTAIDNYLNDFFQRCNSLDCMEKDRFAANFEKFARI